VRLQSVQIFPLCFEYKFKVNFEIENLFLKKLSIEIKAFGFHIKYIDFVEKVNFVWIIHFSVAIFVLKKFNILLKCYQERWRD